jgi:hypothetical protein
MARKNKSACRGSGRQGDAVAGGRCGECSTLQAQAQRVERWTAILRGYEVGVLLVLLRLQPPDGAAFAVRHRCIAQHIGMKRDYSVRAVKRLRELGLVEVVVQGDAKRANEYRMPNPLPVAPQVAALLPKGGK